MTASTTNSMLDVWLSTCLGHLVVKAQLCLSSGCQTVCACLVHIVLHNSLIVTMV